MALSEVITAIQEHFSGALQIAAGPTPYSLRHLIERVSAVRCSPEEFEREAKPISPEEARALLVSTLHISMAYPSFEYMPIEQARLLASAFIAALGEDVGFYSTCCPPMDDQQSVGSWYFMVTESTFESVLYCKGKDETALVVVVDED